METLVQALISGLVFGAIYAIMTMGLTLVYGCLRTLNMAQGAFGMVGGYAAWVITTDMGAPPVVGLVVGAIAAAGVGILTHFISIKPLVGRKDIDFEMTAYISTLVVAIMFSAAIILCSGPATRPSTRSSTAASRCSARSPWPGSRSPSRWSPSSASAA